MNAYVGNIKLFAFNYAPRNWMHCEGQLLQIQQYNELFSLIGTTYGGDGRVTFALPDLRGKSPESGLHFCICVMQQMVGRRGN